MNRKIIIAVLLLLIAAGADGKQYVLSYTGTSAGAANAVIAGGGRVVRDHPQIRVMIVESNRAGFLEAVAANASIENIIEDEIVAQAPRAVTGPVAGPMSAPSAAAGIQSPMHAPLLPLQWGIFKTQTDLAWNLTQGSPQVSVAVVDTGICAHHMDLAGKVDAARSASFVPADQEIGVCPHIYPPACPDCPPWEDGYFHGTAVASLISTNNLGMAGVAPQVSMFAVKVCSCEGWCFGGDVISGILHAADAGADVINISLGSYMPKNAKTPWGPAGRLIALETRALNYARSKGALVVAAAGNDGINLDKDRNMATSFCLGESAACVGGTSYLDELSQFGGPGAPPGVMGSNYGVTGPLIMAPAGGYPTDGNVLHAGILVACAPHGIVPPLFFGFTCQPNYYLLLQGTSFAAPLAAGAAALADSNAPRGAGSMNAGQLRGKLSQNADDLGKPGVDGIFSHGRLNTYKAVLGK